MRLRLAKVLPLFLATLALSAPQESPTETTDRDPRAAAVADDSPKDTVFNGQTVPPIPELDGTSLEQDIANGYWLVKAFSPWCHHCKALAPKWQTLYEYYYTSDPVPASKEPVDSQASLNSFSRYYNFKFGSIDCTAFGTACIDVLGVQSFPTLLLMKNGKEIKRATGDKSMKNLSKFIEESLESIRPGSRPKDGIELPAVGAHEVAMAEKTYADKQASNLKGDRKSKGKTKPKDPSKPEPVGGIANPQGKSKVLSAESFQRHITKTLDPWLIKFYVPWCHHCQALAPSWEAMAREMKGRLNVGEVNCEVERRLCKDAHVSAYPTIALFKGPERIDYEGLRGLGDLINYADSATAAVTGVPEVTLQEFEELEKTEEVIFVYFHDHATTSEDFQALERLPIHLIGHGKIVKSSDAKLAQRFAIFTWPRLVVSRDGKTKEYPGLMPQHMRDVPKLIGWMQANWLPLVPELNSANSHDIMDGKFVVLGILSRERSDEFTIAKREIKNAAIEWMEKQEQAFQLERQELRDAKQLRIEEAEDRRDQRALRDAKLIRINMDEIQRKDVAFAWVDGIFWERWIRQTFGISVADGEKVIMYDLDNHRYWDNTITGNPIVPSRTSILETLPKVVVSPPKLTPKATGSSIAHFFFRLRNAIINHPIVAVGLLIGFTIASFLGRRTLRRRRVFGSNTGGYFHLDGKEGLLGTTNGNGKAD
ncbi:MAG: hypothetical protein M1828_006599 [Chrysothrix sp. TS-e1954]|nr:MAG: hypothetical protein M1828_006599 [Chrysothrix sp. TS-e1954]